MKYRKTWQESLYPQEKIQKVARKTQQIIAGNVSRCDPNGSYTGVPLDPKEVPVQDADDL